MRDSKIYIVTYLFQFLILEFLVSLSQKYFIVQYWLKMGPKETDESNIITVQSIELHLDTVQNFFNFASSSDNYASSCEICGPLAKYIIIMFM